jgi:hypothetical protein
LPPPGWSLLLRGSQGGFQRPDVFAASAGTLQAVRGVCTVARPRLDAHVYVVESLSAAGDFLQAVADDRDVFPEGDDFVQGGVAAAADLQGAGAVLRARGLTVAGLLCLAVWASVWALASGT